MINYKKNVLKYIFLVIVVILSIFNSNSVRIIHNIMIYLSVKKVVGTYPKKKRRLTLYTNYKSKIMISIFRYTFMKTDTLHFEEQNE